MKITHTALVLLASFMPLTGCVSIHRDAAPSTATTTTTTTPVGTDTAVQKTTTTY
ncbi:MAG: hypothetical protein ABI443_08140 [Chthoniobacterales bacterium]